MMSGQVNIPHNMVRCIHMKFIKRAASVILLSLFITTLPCILFGKAKWQICEWSHSVVKTEIKELRTNNNDLASLLHHTEVENHHEEMQPQILSNLFSYKKSSQFNLKKKYMHYNNTGKEECLPSTVFLRKSSGKVSVCKRSTPLPGACKITRDIMNYSKSPAKCPDQHHQICIIRQDNNVVVCNTSICEKEISIGWPNITNGEITWKQVINNTLQKVIEEIIPGHNYTFVFISCNERDNTSHQIQQLLLLPPNFSRHEYSQREKTAYNLNIIHLDSASRSLFYRALPKTIAAMKKLHYNNQSHFSVADFEIFSAVQTRTYEALQVLFSGRWSKLVGEASKVPLEHTVAVEQLLGPLKEHGYKTLWVEEECWYLGAGILTYIHKWNPNMKREIWWQDAMDKLRDSGIDDLSLSLATCKVFDYLGVRDQFQGPDAVCFNGKQYHDYLLKYLQMYQSAAEDAGHPTFSYYMSDIPHEPTGRRLRTLDKELAAHIKWLAHQKNTITVIFADHGSTYGRLQYMTAEAQAEIYNPALFMLLPKSLSHIMGHHSFDNLLHNQQRLVSTADLHYTLSYLIHKMTNNATYYPHHEPSMYNVDKKGLWEAVPANRTCSDVPHRPEDWCICENTDDKVSLSSHHSLLVDYIIGKINDNILRQIADEFVYSKMSWLQSGQHCYQLIPLKFELLKETTGKDGQVTTWILVHLASPLSDTSELLMIVTKASSIFAEPVIIKKQRLSSYGPYEACAHPAVDASICLCHPWQHLPDYYRNQLVDLPEINENEHNKGDLYHSYMSKVFPSDYVEGKCVSCEKDNEQLVFIKTGAENITPDLNISQTADSTPLYMTDVTDPSVMIPFYHFKTVKQWSESSLHTLDVASKMCFLVNCSFIASSFSDTRTHQKNNKTEDKRTTLHSHKNTPVDSDLNQNDTGNHGNTTSDNETVMPGVDCLVISYRDHNVGVMLTLFNICDKLPYDVTFRVTGQNICTWPSDVIDVYLPPGESNTLCVIMPADITKRWSWRYAATVSLESRKTAYLFY